MRMILRWTGIEFFLLGIVIILLFCLSAICFPIVGIVNLASKIRDRRQSRDGKSS